MPDILILITARGGSKSIPNKNIALLAGKPLIAWTIEAALKAKTAGRIIVSTDDNKILKVAEKWGAETPFVRPVELAGDFSPHIDVVLHALNWLETYDSYRPDYILLLQPTSPLRTASDIDRAIEIAIEKDADSVVSVCESPVHPYFIRKITKQGMLTDFIKKPEGYLPRQKLPQVYKENGAIYLVRRRVFVEEKKWYPLKTYPYIMPPDRSVDIDILFDLQLAEIILKNKLERN